MPESIPRSETEDTAVESESTIRASRISSAMGLPNLRGNGKFLAANLIDSLGNGAMLAFQVAFFVMTTDLSAIQIGGAVTLARLLSLPAPLLVGPAMDRFGPRAVMTTGNLVSSVTFLGFLVADQVWSIMLTGLLVQVGAAMFWTAQGALVALAAKGGDRRRWFALVRVLRNLGIGAGGALAAGALALFGPQGLTGLVVLTAVSFACAAWLIGTWAAGAGRPARADDDEQPSLPGDRATPSYLEVLRDGRYLRLVLANLAFVLASMILSVLLTVYIVDSLREGAWLGGMLLLINTLVVILAQTVVIKKVEKVSPARVLVVAAVVDAVAFLLFALVASVPSVLVVAGLVLATLFFTMGEMLTAPSISELSIALSREAARGRYLGFFQLSWGIGVAVAPYLFMGLIEIHATLPWLVLAGSMVAVIPLLLTLRTRPKENVRV